MGVVGWRTSTGRALAAALLLAGGVAAVASRPAVAQSAQPAEPEAAIRATYRCLGRFDAVDLTALFFNRPPSEVVLLVGEMATRLPLQRSADGGRYAAGDQEFWIKGDRATWRIGQAPPMACGPQP